MKRKVNLVGQNTLTISLPSKWVERNKIKKGDELEIEEGESQLFVATTKTTFKTQKTLHLAITEEVFSERTITMPYVRGYNHIKISFNDISSLDKIENTLDKTPGFEIIKQGKDFVEIKNIFSEDTEEFDTVLERLYNVILVGLQEISDEFMLGDFKNIKFIEKLSRDSDKYDLFCRRMMNTKSYSDEIRNFSIYAIIKNYELIGDIFKELFYYIEHNHLGKSLEISRLVGDIIRFLKFTHKIYHSEATIDHIIETKRIRTDFRTSYDKILLKLTTKELVSALGLINQIYYSVNHISDETLYLNYHR